MNKKEFINKLYKDYTSPSVFRNWYTNLLNTVSADIYTDKQRFLFELIQNADDEWLNNENEILFDFYSDWLFISHNWRPFNQRDIEAITSAWNGTKNKDKSKTGYKWIWFKSVFSISDKVSIFSNWFNFCFDKNHFKEEMPWQIIPIWINDNNKIENKVIDNYSVTTFLEINDIPELQKEVDELLNDENILLFLRNINKISVSIGGKHSYSIKKEIKPSSDIYNNVTIFKDNIEISKWIVKTFWNIEIPSDIHNKLNNDNISDKLKESEFTEFSFAAKIVDNKIVWLVEAESLLYTYLPTNESKYAFPFIVNASFDIDASRESLKDDSEWNIWLFKLIAEKSFDWLELLWSSEYKYQVLNILPKKYSNSLNNNKLMNSFNDSFNNSIKSKKFILDQNNCLNKVSDILIDKTWLSEENIIPKTDLIMYINKSKNKTFENFSIIHNKLESTSKLTNLDIAIFKSDELTKFLQDDIFIYNHNLNDNYKLINYLFKKSIDLGTKDFDDKLKVLPFIYSNDDKLCNIKEISFPSSNNYSNSNLSVVHSNIYINIKNNNELINWLEELWIKEVTDDTYLKYILKNLDNEIDENNYLEKTRFLFKKYKEWKFNISDFDILNDLKILTTKDNLIKVDTSYLSDIYEPKLKLEESLDEDIFISEEYIENNDLKSEWKAFFIRIWWLDEINIFKDNNRNINSDSFKEYLKINVEEIKSEHSYPYKISENNYVSFDNIRFIDFTINYKFSKLFWGYIMKNINLEDINEKAKMDRGHYGSSEPMNSYIIWFFNNAKIFPNSTGECLKASDIFINNDEVKEFILDYLPVLDNNIDLENSLIKQIWFKTELLLEDYLLILEKISEDVDENGLCKNQKLIWKIYNKLIKKTKDITEEDKKIINDWWRKNKILSINWKFESITKLSFINNNFFIKNQELELVLVPNNCNKDLKQLFKLFWVIILDKPILENNDDRVENIDIKNKLFLILPYLSTIIEKEQYEDSDKEYDRIAKIINNITFYSLDNINLFFKKESIDIRTSWDITYIENKNFYFKWDWNKIFVLWDIVKDLCKLLNINDYVMKLQQLLGSDEEDILNWFDDLDYDIWKLINKPEYIKVKELIKISEYREVSEGNIDIANSWLNDNSNELFRSSVNLETRQKIIQKMKNEWYIIPSNLDSNYSIVKWITDLNWNSIVAIMKSAKKWIISFNSNELKHLSNNNSKLVIETRDWIIKNFTIKDINDYNENLVISLNMDTFTSKKDLDKLAKLMEYSKWVHYLFNVPEITSDFLEEFWLDKKDNFSIDNSPDDIKLLD
jgi:hypothetical protein